MADTNRSNLHGFEERDAFGRRNRPAVERIITEGLGLSQPWYQWIEREDEDFELDRKLGIDLKIQAGGLGQLTAQIKTLSTDYRTITVESFEGDGSPGDLWNCSASLYVVAYCDEGGRPMRWAILDWSRLVLASVTGKIRWKHSKNSDGRARAEFVYVTFSELEQFTPEAVIASGGDW